MWQAFLRLCHAGEGKRVYGMTGRQEKVMPERGKRGMWHDKIAEKSHAGERKRGMWHDWVAGEGHTGEGKMVCGMTGRG